jgi:YHS domain-containing protein
MASRLALIGSLGSPYGQTSAIPPRKQETIEMAPQDKCHKAYWTARVATGLLLASAGTFVCHVYADATEKEQETQAVQEQQAPESAVQRELDALYAEHGGIAPEMTKEAASKAVMSQQNPKNATRPPVALPTSTQAAAQKKKSRSFFLFGPRKTTGSKTAQAAPSQRRPGSSQARPTAGPAPRAHSQAAKTKPKSNIQPAQFTADEIKPQASPSESSPIMRELKKLYAKDGREFPKLPSVKMTRGKAQPQPVAAAKKQPVAAAKKTASASAQPVKKPNLLQRLFRGSRRKPQVAQQTQAPKPQTPPTTPEPELLPVGGVASDDAKTQNEAADDLGNPFGEETTPQAEIALDEQEISQPVIRPIPVSDEPELKAADPEPASAVSKTEDKLRRIAERKGMSGFKGFCPVTLCDSRELVDTVPEFSSTVGLRVYYFSTSDAKVKFDADVEKYTPAAEGNDVVLQASQSQDVEGSLDHAVWYRGRLYLFDTAESKSEFRKTPATYATQPVE